MRSKWQRPKYKSLSNIEFEHLCSSMVSDYDYGEMTTTAAKTEGAREQTKNAELEANTKRELTRVDSIIVYLKKQKKMSPRDVESKINSDLEQNQKLGEFLQEAYGLHPDARILFDRFMHRENSMQVVHAYQATLERRLLGSATSIISRLNSNKNTLHFMIGEKGQEVDVDNPSEINLSKEAFIQLRIKSELVIKPGKDYVIGDHKYQSIDIAYKLTVVGFEIMDGADRYVISRKDKKPIYSAIYRQNIDNEGIWPIDIRQSVLDKVSSNVLPEEIFEERMQLRDFGLSQKDEHMPVVMGALSDVCQMVSAEIQETKSILAPLLSRVDDLIEINGFPIDRRTHEFRAKTVEGSQSFTQQVQAHSLQDYTQLQELCQSKGVQLLAEQLPVMVSVLLESMDFLRCREQAGNNVFTRYYHEAKDGVFSAEQKNSEVIKYGYGSLDFVSADKQGAKRDQSCIDAMNTVSYARDGKRERRQPLPGDEGVFHIMSDTLELLSKVQYYIQVVTSQKPVDGIDADMIDPAVSMLIPIPIALQQLNKTLIAVEDNIRRIHDFSLKQSSAEFKPKEVQSADVTLLEDRLSTDIQKLSDKFGLDEYDEDVQLTEGQREHLISILNYTRLYLPTQPDNGDNIGSLKIIIEETDLLLHSITLMEDQKKEQSDIDEVNNKIAKKMWKAIPLLKEAIGMSEAPYAGPPM